MTGIKERFDNLYNYPVGEEPGTDYSGASDLYTGGMNKKSMTALISGGLALAGQGINYFANRETNQANREMQQEANQHNIELWRAQTRYNTPANQIARLRQANLNPNLIYGNPVNTAGSAPEMKASKNERYQLDPMTMANVMLMSKQMEQLESQKEVNLATAKDLNATSEGKRLDNSMKQFDLDKQQDSYDRNAREQEENINFLKNKSNEVLSNIDLNKQLGYESFMRESKLKIERDFLKDTKEYDKLFKVLGLYSSYVEIQEAKAKVADFYSQIEYRQKQGLKVDAETLTEILKGLKIESDISLQEVNKIIKMGSSDYNVGLLYQKMLNGTATPAEIDEFKLNYLQDYLTGFTKMGALGKFTALILLGTFM